MSEDYDVKIENCVSYDNRSEVDRLRAELVGDAAVIDALQKTSIQRAGEIAALTAERDALKQQVSNLEQDMAAYHANVESMIATWQERAEKAEAVCRGVELHHKISNSGDVISFNSFYGDALSAWQEASKP